MIEVMEQEIGFTNIAAEINSSENANSIFVERPEHRPLTKFEQRGHRLGHGVWDIMYKRVS